MQGRLILYDTCNFRDYPVGGQVTSIKSFLRYIGESHAEYQSRVLLVGVTTVAADMGKILKIEINGFCFNFLAVALAGNEQNNVKKSLRISYLKGLWKYRKFLALGVADVNYIHTGEAYGVVHILCRKAPCYIFSHGTYLGMWKRERVRFFRKALFVRLIFQRYLISAIKNCDGVFVLDKKTRDDYLHYNRNVILTTNSILCQAFTPHMPDLTHVRFLYAGRLSSVKNIGPIIEAIKGYAIPCELEVLGAGEEAEKLRTIANERIRFLGIVTPDKVLEYMKKSDILIMNSTSEGMPMTILEAISTGLPVITTDVGGIKEVLQYGVDSEVTDGTVLGIQAAMDKVLSHYQARSKAAYQKSKKYDYRTVNAEIFKELKKALSRSVGV